MKNKQENREIEKIVFKQLSLKIIAVVIRKMICHLKTAVKLLVDQKKSSRKKINSKQIVTSEVATVLDRVNVSDRKATMVIAAVTKHLGNELEEVTLSRSTVRRVRKSNW